MNKKRNTDNLTTHEKKEISTIKKEKRVLQNRCSSAKSSIERINKRIEQYINEKNDMKNIIEKKKVDISTDPRGIGNLKRTLVNIEKKIRNELILIKEKKKEIDSIKKNIEGINTYISAITNYGNSGFEKNGKKYNELLVVKNKFNKDSVEILKNSINEKYYLNCINNVLDREKFTDIELIVKVERFILLNKKEYKKFNEANVNEILSLVDMLMKNIISPINVELVEYSLWIGLLRVYSKYITLNVENGNKDKYYNKDKLLIDKFISDFFHKLNNKQQVLYLSFYYMYKKIDEIEYFDVDTLLEYKLIVEKEFKPVYKIVSSYNVESMKSYEMYSNIKMSSFYEENAKIIYKNDKFYRAISIYNINKFLVQQYITNENDLNNILSEEELNFIGHIKSQIIANGNKENISVYCLWLLIFRILCRYVRSIVIDELETKYALDCNKDIEKYIYNNGNRKKERIILNLVCYKMYYKMEENKIIKIDTIKDCIDEINQVYDNYLLRVQNEINENVKSQIYTDNIKVREVIFKFIENIVTCDFFLDFDLLYRINNCISTNDLETNNDSKIVGFIKKLLILKDLLINKYIDEDISEFCLWITILKIYSIYLEKDFKEQNISMYFENDTFNTDLFIKDKYYFISIDDLQNKYSKRISFIYLYKKNKAREFDISLLSKYNQEISSNMTNSYYKIKKEIEKNNFIQKLVGSNGVKEYSIDDIDLMSGTEFEEYLLDMFRKKGFKANMTKATGDQGIDLVMEKNGQRIGVQAKRYSNSVGNKAVQEAIGGKKYYKLDKVMVITNNYFTSSAEELAVVNNVILWNRDILKDKL